MTTRAQMIVETLKAHPDEQFTARALAARIVERYPKELANKRKNDKFRTEDDFIQQITAEVGGQRTQAAKEQCPNVVTRDRPRPRIYYWSENPAMQESPAPYVAAAGSQTVEINDTGVTRSEHDLYPILIEYLSEEQSLQCRRIDERRSRNTKGMGGNHWLYPDVVALQPLDAQWEETVQTCVRASAGKTTRLWSFEVKQELTRGNVRQCFFQTVSNSSWANFGYLVATEIREDQKNSVERELQMLSTVHGIGVILLEPDDLSNSQILIPAREKSDVDWESVNRLVEENSDFHDFIELTGIYHQTGKLRKAEWNK